MGDGEVVLQVPAHRLVDPDRLDAMFPQEGFRPDPGQLQQLRRVDRAAAQDDFPAGRRRAGPAPVDELDAGGPCPVEQDPGRMGTGEDGDVRPFHRRAEVRAGRGHAPPGPGGDLVQAHALLVRPVEVGIRFQAAGHGRVDEAPVEGVVAGTDVVHVQRPGVAAPPVAPPGIGFGAPEIGQHVVPAPARVPHGEPVIVVGMLSADVHHGVDGTGPAQHLAPRPVASPAPQALVRLGGVPPVDRRVVEGLAVADGRLDPEPVVGAPRLQHEHAETAVLGQAAGENAARRPGADNQEIELHQAGGILRVDNICPADTRTRAAGSSAAGRNGTRLIKARAVSG